MAACETSGSFGNASAHAMVPVQAPAFPADTSITVALVSYAVWLRSWVQLNLFFWNSILSASRMHSMALAATGAGRLPNFRNYI